MSIQAVGWVLDWSPTRGTDRLVLIAIANHAGTSAENGAWEAWPGIETIAREAGLDRTRTAQESLARLSRDGHLERVLNGAPDGRIRRDRRPNLYRILTLQRGDAPPHPVTANGVTPPRTPSPVDNHRDGVPPHGTPSIERGDAPASNGVTPERSTGCYQASPEPLVEPSMNQPPSPEPRGLPPTDDPSGGVETIHQPPGIATTADQRRERIRAACMLIAARLAERTAGISRPDRWIAATADRLTGQHAAAGHRHLVDHPDLAPEALAELLERPEGAELSPHEQLRRQHERAEATREHIRDTLAQPGDRVRSAERARELRERFRRPEQENTA